MKRRWIALALLLALAVSLTACQVEFVPYGRPTNNGGTTIDTPLRPGGDTDPVDVTDPVGGEEDPSGDNTDYTMEKYRQYLEGEWVGVEAEVEGDRYKLADEEMSVTLNPKNIIDSGRFQITTPEVKIAVAPEYSHMIEARVIDGRRYILIPADEGVEINGIGVNIPNPQRAEETEHEKL